MSNAMSSTDRNAELVELRKLLLAMIVKWESRRLEDRRIASHRKTQIMNFMAVESSSNPSAVREHCFPA